MVADAADQVGEIGLGVHAIELAALDQGEEDRRPLAAAVGAEERPVATSEELWRKLGDGGEEGGVTGLVIKPPEPPRWSVTP